MCIIFVNVVGSMDSNLSCMKNNLPNIPCSVTVQNTPKVRKGYTIKKQREKWTVEEHQKFLEAIKLHGRAWKSVEGTKNAVQIRSHAQKFLSKVVHLSTNGSVESIVEIPPPRPKKKSVHPYPRKLNSVDKGDPSSVHSVTYQENVSQESTSVKKKIGPSASSVQNHSTISDSCVTGSIFPVSGFINPKIKGENVGLVSGCAALTSEDEHIEEMNHGSSMKSFQLFGKTIIVADPNISRLVMQNPEIKEVASIDAATSTAPHNQCSHGLLPLFEFMSQMDPSAAQSALANLYIKNSRI